MRASFPSSSELKPSPARPLRTLVNLLVMLVWESGIELPELTLVTRKSQ
jgi:hypothetical protein